MEISSRFGFGIWMPTVDFPGMRSIRTDSACIARHRSSARPVTLLYLTPASGLNSYVVTTGPGCIWTTDPSTENSRHFSSSSRAPSMSSRSSILRSPFGASSSASGGSVYVPFFRSAGSLSGSDKGRDAATGAAGDRRIVAGVGAGRDDAALSAAAAAPIMAAVREGFFGASSGAPGLTGMRRPASAAEPPASKAAAPVAILGLISGFASFAALSRCFLMTSWRCLSRRRSSRHPRYIPNNAAHRSRSSWPTTANRRPNENCVDRMIARNSSVRIRMMEPLRLRYADSTAASRSPM